MTKVFFKFKFPKLLLIIINQKQAGNGISRRPAEGSKWQKYFKASKILFRNNFKSQRIFLKEAHYFPIFVERRLIRMLHTRGFEN